jgi:transposase
MRQYSEERKASLLNKLLPPHNKTYTELSKEEGVPATTIYTWIKKRTRVDTMSSKSVKASGIWSVEARFSAIVETATLSEVELGEYCREKGLYPEQLKQWKNECIAGLTQKPACIHQEKSQGKGDKKRISHLEKELRRKEKALAEAAALLILGKKLQAFYEEGSEDA